MARTDAEIVTEAALSGPYVVSFGELSAGAAGYHCVTCGYFSGSSVAIETPQKHAPRCIWRMAKEARE